MARQPAKRFFGKRSIAMAVFAMIMASIGFVVFLRRQDKPTHAAAEAVSVSKPIGPLSAAASRRTGSPWTLPETAHPLDPVWNCAASVSANATTSMTTAAE